MDQLGPRIGVAAVGVVFAAVGLVMAFNFRGHTERQARRSLESVRWLEGRLERVPPWKWLLRRPLERRIAQQVRLARVIGAVFVGAGVLILVAAVVGQFTPGTPAS
jgi:ABC-type Fe3+-siderophore transport system permease subunit